MAQPSLRHSRGSCKCEVFLGGSCNPTTWRRDAAIPALHKAGVTYFNPVMLSTIHCVFCYSSCVVFYCSKLMSGTLN